MKGMHWTAFLPDVSNTHALNTLISTECDNATMCMLYLQIFTRTCDSTRKIALMLRALGFGAVPIHGQMSQPKRLGALNKFKSGERNILVATGTLRIEVW